MLRDETHDLYEAHEAVPFMVLLGQPEDRSNQQLRRFAREGWIHSHHPGGNAPKCHSYQDIAAAIAQSAVIASGIRDHEVMRATSDALYRWQLGQTEEEYSPIIAALYGLMENQCWVLE